MQIINPVLPGFHPDPSIVRAGDGYIVATSTFEWFPGVRLHRSADLVTWKPAGHVLTSVDQLDLAGIPDSGGVWAPSLSYAGGRYWLVYSVLRTLGKPYKDLDNFLVTAPAPEGPWSDPVYLNSSGFDPSLFHDDDGRHYLLNVRWDHREGQRRFGGILLQEFDAAAGRLIGRPQVIMASEELIEGPDLYKRGSEYFLMLAEGGTGANHGIRMARAPSVDGPYQPDDVALLTTRDVPAYPLQNAGHGSLVETPGGEWYLAHLASRPLRTPEGPRSILGRETCLQKVVWADDGWLRLAHGGHHPALTVAVPDRAAGAAVVPEPMGLACAEESGFDPGGLSEGWASLRRPTGADWLDLTTRPGWARLRGGHSLQSQFAQSLVARRLVTTRCTITTAVEFCPRDITHMAGLVLYYDTRGYYYLRLSHDDHLGRVLGIVANEAEDTSEHANIPLDEGRCPVVHLRADLGDARLRFSYSHDGAQWTPIGPVFDAGTLSDDYGGRLRFTGAFAGICAQDLSGSSIYADFAHFTTRLEDSARWD
ncbi:glycoside hydrolase family 43 protein [Phytoactinopolyspora mesophila]|uniref:Family 43 glycosylhydrolase n=1 Tax=Phytoactinopolyspora mesophila TaxID=2650750 RepID=A0A7K3M2Q9_9ACTN|nr:glycoside hydrolase family 43 protein [Phytoactinopolyspora mesophila]NDL57202.1 family 43 glycosylhydrolase [Phytoactinopolyspora mesophila]